MAKTTRLDGERLRELARICAEVTLRRLRAEMVAIERAFRSSNYLRNADRCALPYARHGRRRERCPPRGAEPCLCQ
jgi:hypothetical protein